MTRTVHDETRVTYECGSCGCIESNDLDEEFEDSYEVIETPTPEIIAKADAISSVIEDVNVRRINRNLIIAVEMKKLAREKFESENPPEKIVKPEPVNPFTVPEPYKALTKIQKARLHENWERDEFGPVYQKGTWAKCEVSRAIAYWYKDEPKSLFISGQVGVGKSTSLGLLMVALAARNEFDWRYWNASELFNYLRNVEDEPGKRDEKLTEIINCKYLIIDDLGTEYSDSTGWNVHRFNTMIERRYRQGNSIFIVTTNIKTEELLRERPNMERSVDRMLSNSVWCYWGGVSQR